MKMLYGYRFTPSQNFQALKRVAFAFYKLQGHYSDAVN